MTAATATGERSAGRPRRPEGPTRVTGLSHELVRLSRTLQVVRTAVAAAGGVPWSTFQLLLHLVHDGPQRASALAGSVSTDPSTISRQIDVLVRLGLAERRADPDDGRATLVVATEAGHARQRQMASRRDQAFDAVVADWADDEIEALSTLLERLNDDLAAELPTITARLQGAGADLHRTEDPA